MPIDQATREARKAEALAARRAAMRPELRQHCERQDRERAARNAAKAHRAMERTKGIQTCSMCGVTQPLDHFPLQPTGKPNSRCKPCKAAQVKASRQRRRRGEAPLNKPRDIDPNRLARLISALDGANPEERIDSEESWHMTVAEVRRLWGWSGEKECSSCKQAVPAAAMLPPGPGNFYPGQCNSCARKAYREGHLKVFGEYPREEASRILLRDGSTITIGELAGRHRERQKRYRFPRFARGSWL